MPVAETLGVVRLRPPHGGLDLGSLRRALLPGDARVAQNVVTARRGIDVRDPVRLFKAHNNWLGAGVDPASILIALRTFSRGGDYVAFGEDDLIYVEVYGPGWMPNYRKRFLLEQDGTLVASWNHSGGALGSAVQAKACMYSFDELNGDNSQKIYYDGAAWVMYQVGLDAITSLAAIRVNQGAGNFPINLKVWHRATYYNSKVGVESPASDAVETSSGVNTFDVQVSWNASTDPQVDKVRIYRMHEGTDDTWYLAHECAHNASPWVDMNQGIDKTFDTAIVLEAEAPPRTRAACWHKNRMWYAPTDDEGTVIHSELYDPELASPLNSYGVGGNDGKPVRAMFSLGGYLFVLKTRGIWAIAGDGPDTFAADEIDSEAGCIAPRSVVVVPGRAVLFVGQRGVYRMTNQGAVFIGEPIASAWAESSMSHQTKTTVAYDERLGVAIFNIPKNQGAGARQFVYNPQTNKWTQWDIPARGVGAATGPSQAYGECNRAYFVKDHATLSDLIRLETPADDADWRDFLADAIAWEWQTGELDMGIQNLKRFKNVRTSWIKGAAADAINAQHRIDENGSFTGGSGLLNAAPPRCVVPVGRTGETLAVKLSGNATRKTELAGMEIEAEVLAK